MTDFAPFSPAPDRRLLGATRLGRPASGVVRIVADALRRGIRDRWTPLMCLAVVFVDQATKAVRPGGTFVVNTGGVALLPAPLERMLWKSQTYGAVCDTADMVL